MPKVLLQRFCCQKRTKLVFFLMYPFSLKIFINMFAFLYAKAKSIKTCEEIFFFLFPENC